MKPIGVQVLLNATTGQVALRVVDHNTLIEIDVFAALLDVSQPP